MNKIINQNGVYAKLPGLTDLADLPEKVTINDQRRCTTSTVHLARLDAGVRVRTELFRSTTLNLKTTSFA